MSSLNVPRCYKHYTYSLSRIESSRPSLSSVFKPVIMECADDLELNRDRLCVIYDSHISYMRIYYFDESSGCKRGPVEISRSPSYYNNCAEVFYKMRELI